MAEGGGESGAEPGEGRGVFGPGLACRRLHLYYVAGTLPPARGSLPGSGFFAWCNNRGRSEASIERVACATGARHGVSGIGGRSCNDT